MSTGSKELWEKGLQNRREVVGGTYVDSALKNGSSEFAFAGQQMVTEWAWGNVWSRPGLDRKQRSLLNIGMLMSLRSWPEFGVHIRGAINNGLSELEIREAILHASVYLGLPAGVEAFKVAERTLNDMVEKDGYQRTLGHLSPEAQTS
ncbi:AhpD-like protein [Emericellopsis atlantica]|uniref:AhpD-like protein n=1 Tax=Emericellopsis atlantica TaxID=2614577 RepID=A0A9P7ZLJ0_9HYPO|nr:AhpD-like protein [Emericellopsis atlantica]KAG9253922.1 AhpD-like protein [Emericellopsis atlantica]